MGKLKKCSTVNNKRNQGKTSLEWSPEQLTSWVQSPPVPTGAGKLFRALPSQLHPYTLTTPQIFLVRANHAFHFANGPPTQWARQKMANHAMMNSSWLVPESPIQIKVQWRVSYRSSGLPPWTHWPTHLCSESLPCVPLWKWSTPQEVDQRTENFCQKSPSYPVHWVLHAGKDMDPGSSRGVGTLS
jgi:hypothetical protein